APLPNSSTSRKLIQCVRKGHCWAFAAKAAENISSMNIYSVQFGYTVHLRPFIRNGRNSGGFWQRIEVCVSIQGFQPAVVFSHVPLNKGRSSCECLNSTCTVLPFSSSRRSEAPKRRRWS